MAEWKILTCESPVDRERLRYAIWSKTDSFSSVILHVNGRTEWLEKGFYLPEALGMENWTDDVAMISFDHRGQGGSGGKKADVTTYDHFVRDLSFIIQREVQDRKFAILAHSMGCLISLYGSLKNYFRPHSLICSSPLLGLPQHPLPSPYLRYLTTTLETLHLDKWHIGDGKKDIRKFENNILTRDRNFFKILCETPYLIPAPTIRWINATFRALDIVHDPNYLSKIDFPILVLAAGAERVVDPKSAKRWCRLAKEYSHEHVKFKCFEDARHELFGELPEVRKEVFADCYKWWQATNFLKSL